MTTTSTPGGRLGASCANFSLTASMVARAFFPERITTTPPATSPSPSNSAMPRRISGPTCTMATSFSSMYSVSASSTTEPPEDRFAFWIASITMPCVTLVWRIRSGSSTTWYWRTMPPMLATSATSWIVFSSNFRNQSLSARS